MTYCVVQIALEVAGFTLPEGIFAHLDLRPRSGHTAPAGMNFIHCPTPFQFHHMHDILPRGQWSVADRLVAYDLLRCTLDNGMAVVRGSCLVENRDRPSYSKAYREDHPYSYMPLMRMRLPLVSCFLTVVGRYVSGLNGRTLVRTIGQLFVGHAHKRALAPLRVLLCPFGQVRERPRHRLLLCMIGLAQRNRTSTSRTRTAYTAVIPVLDGLSGRIRTFDHTSPTRGF